MGIYINGIGLISPQETRDNNDFLSENIPLEQSYFHISEPPYKEYINPRELRRMSKIIRNGIISAKIALADAKIEMPEAIITGTGLGCAIDTEKFLIKMIENEESLLTPTSFIQSTHNTLGGSIAIGLGCHEYNMTYVHRGLSFETALLDAQLMMQAGELNNALVGGFDEMTDNHILLLQQTEMYQPGAAVAGQASGFFALETIKRDNSYAELIELDSIYNPDDAFQEIGSKMSALKRKYPITDENTVVIMGYNGVQKETFVYNGIMNSIFPTNMVTHFKHLCGEFYTASAFAFWMAAQMLKKQIIPDVVHYNYQKVPGKIEYVLIYNQFQEKEHSIILLKKC